MERPETIIEETNKEKTNKGYIQPGQVLNPNGRPKGTGNKLSVKSLLSQLSDTVGVPYEQQLAENYRDAIVSQDTKLIYAYDNLFLSKLLADKVSVEVAEDAQIVAAKRDAFMAALSSYGQAVIVEHNTITVEATVTHDTQNSPQADQDRSGDDE